MNGEVVTAIARRDLQAVVRSGGVLAPMLIVPVVFVVVLPVAAWGVSKTEMVPVLTRLLELLPPSLMEGLPEDQALRVALVLATYVFPILLVVVPLMVASVMATDSVAGERERDTLEGLLLAPVSDREILVGKLLGAIVPAIAIGLLASILYAVAVNVLLGPPAGQLVLPTLPWTLMVVWFGPAFAAAGLGFTVLVSARSSSVQAAMQLSGVVVLPLIGLVAGQLVGLLLVRWWVVLMAGAGLWALAAVLIAQSARVLRREPQIASAA